MTKPQSISLLYQKWQGKLVFNNRNGRILWNMKVYRLLVLVTTWLGFESIHGVIKAKDVEPSTQKAYRKALAYTWIKAASKKDELINLPKKDDYFGQLVLMPLLTDIVLRAEEKVVIWCLFPAEQVLVLTVLQLVGIDAKILSADLSVSEREHLVQAFTTDPERVMVLVCSYNVSSTGLNLQKLCRNVVIFSPPTSKASQDQAIGRVKRLGQTHVVHVYEIRVRDSFNIRQVITNITKAVPALVADLNSRIFHIEEADMGGTIDLGEWAKLPNGRLVKRGEQEENDIPDDMWLQGDYVVTEILRTMQGELIPVDA
ncbi:hypothetical protein TESG_05112 [Trichophyton tonsurans CBS 112818]|uniref:Helicase C-terminal domain-containing protein n=1 Tax=Trichophyton tonsurans (strain CBS 112818) TaxID=647933 RepID=F2S2B2_TRIT1|nr:hypothetical protein TESG_05112 [Trichophyton tonsurans CBS 112818]